MNNLGQVQIYTPTWIDSNRLGLSWYCNLPQFAAVGKGYFASSAYASNAGLRLPSTAVMPIESSPPQMDFG